MTSIYDIPYEDIQEFLLSNNINIENENKDYNKALILLKDKDSKGHTISIIEWMIAHNLLINNIDIPYYTIDDIDSMSQYKINDLAKLLGMKGNNRSNIKNILRYLNKSFILLPEIDDLILNTLSDLEKTDKEILLLIKTGSLTDILSLLKIHRNKKMIRELISDNIEKIIDDQRFNNDNLISFIVELLDNNELGLAKKFYDSLKFNPDFKNLNRSIFNQVYNHYQNYNILLERIFKIMSSQELFDILIQKIKYIDDMDTKLENLYIPFLEISIQLQKLDFTILMIEYFNKKSFEYLKESNSIKIQNLVKQFEDLLDIAIQII